MVRTEKDPRVFLRKVEYYLQNGAYSCDTVVGERSGIRKSSISFIVIGETMFYTQPAKNNPNEKVKRLVMFSIDEQQKVLREAHDINGAHQGQKRTLARLTQDYYWTTMAKDVYSWISTCQRCQKLEQIKTIATELHPIKVSNRWETLGIDLIGPFAATDKGHRYVCTATDLFTKWVFARPIKSKCAADVAKVILELIYSYGPPRKMIMDQGREFINQVNDFIFAAFGVKRMMCSAYHPETNGQDERTNQTLKRALSKYTNDSQTDWNKFVLSTTYGINTSIQASTKQQPFVLMFYRTARGAIAINAEHDCEEELQYVNIHTDMSPEEIKTDLEDRVAKVQALDEQVREKIEEAKAKHKLYFDAKQKKGLKRFQFAIGDHVLKRNVRKASRKGDRLSQDWLGPYKITDITSMGLCTLQDGNGNPIKSKINSGHLKPYLTRSIPDYIAENSPPRKRQCTANLGVVSTLGLQPNKPYTEKQSTIILPPVQPPTRTVDQDQRQPEKMCISTEFSQTETDCFVTGATQTLLRVNGKCLPCQQLVNCRDLPRDFLTTLQSGAWLEDTHINEAQALLHVQFPEMGGLQPVQYLAPGSGGSLTGTPVENYVQIMNTGGHWVCASNIGVSKGTVLFYDSLPTRTKLDTLKGLAWMEHYAGTCLIIQKPKIQRQAGGNDCGLFAIAIATALCGGINPSLITFDQSKMRHHLAMSFQERILLPFPLKGLRRTVTYKRLDERIPLICICRQPHDSALTVAQCCSCKEWFHQSCANIPSSAIANLQEEWNCQQCKERNL